MRTVWQEASRASASKKSAAPATSCEEPARLPWPGSLLGRFWVCTGLSLLPWEGTAGRMSEVRLGRPFQQGPHLAPGDRQPCVGGRLEETARSSEVKAPGHKRKSPCVCHVALGKMGLGDDTLFHSVGAW